MTLSNRESYEDYMVRRSKEEDAKMEANAPEKIDRIVDRIIYKLDLLEKRMKTVETDLAYIYQPASPEEQKIKDYLNK